MERTNVESSNIASVGYDEETRTLHVEFKNKKQPNPVYEYSNVPPVVAHHFMNAPSKGAYFAREIKSKYHATKL